MQNAIEVLKVRGWTPPMELWKKNDPRGSEYGYYTAKALPCGGVEVEKNPNRYVRGYGMPYRMTFPTLLDFEEWSIENT
jgi:hypothetical protein